MSEEETHSHKHHKHKHHSHHHDEEAEESHQKRHDDHHSHHHNHKDKGNTGEEETHNEHNHSSKKKKTPAVGDDDKPDYGRGGSLTFNYNPNKDYTHEEYHAVMKEDVDDMYGFEENNDAGGWKSKQNDKDSWGAVPVDEEYLERAHEGHHVNAHSRGFKENGLDGLPNGVELVNHGTDDRGRKIHYDVGTGEGTYGVIEDDEYAGPRGKLVQGHRQVAKFDADGYISVDRGLKDDDFEPGVRSERATGCLFLVMAPFELLYLFVVLTPYRALCGNPKVSVSG